MASSRIRCLPGLIGMAVALVLGSATICPADQPGQAAPAIRPDVLYLRTGDVAPTPQPLQPIGPQRTPANVPTDHARCVLQLDGPLTPERNAALHALGVRLGDYLPSNAFITDLAGRDASAVAGLGFVTRILPYRAAWRLAPDIGRTSFQTAERRSLATQGDVALNVYLFDDEPFEPTVAAIRALAGARVVNYDFLASQPIVIVTLPAGRVAALADLPAVQFVEEYPEFVLRNNTTRWVVQSNEQDITPLYDNGLHGEGQILGHIDGKVAVNHCSFFDTQPIGPLHRKILAYNESQGYNLHGTHTAGIAVGDAGSFTETRGVAYLAKLVHNSIPSFTETQIFSRFDLHRTQGATVHTNSWGNDGTTAYDGVCRAIDNFSWQYDDNLICFAVTNLSALKNPENAKDLLAVGATEDVPNQDQHCYGGAGPTSDGRRKPEIYAPGCGIQSSSGSSGCSTQALSGTSMACPAISGTALLVRQYFTEGYYPTGTANPDNSFVPSGALLKAVLINSAADMTGVSGYPSNQEGWGRVLAHHSLYFPGDTRKLIIRDARNNSNEALATGQSVAFGVSVNSSNEPLRFTLAFHDAPAAVNAAYAPVNDLDLVVTAPTGEIYTSNYFFNGQSIPGGPTDPRNNVEQIHVLVPSPGIWAVSINAAAVNVGLQGYAVVVTGDVVDGVFIRGDMNCDSLVNFDDINAFVLALGGYDGYHAAYPGCDWMQADCNGDGLVDFDDIDAFIVRLSGG